MNRKIPQHWNWFPKARYGLFIHWGPYSALGRGEQVLFREQLEQREYAEEACRWRPNCFDARNWAKIAQSGGFGYAVMTTRHHDGYCLWDTRIGDYSSARQAPRRDFVREYVEAFREAGLRIGLYYSLADWRDPAYWSDPASNPGAWDTFVKNIHAQVRELLTGYGQIDEIWFDGAWPHSAESWRSVELVRMIKELQPAILVNNRLDSNSPYTTAAGQIENPGESKILGDFGTPEHHITAELHRPWESCQTSTHRLWGYAHGEHWRSAEQWLDFLCEASAKGGNLLLNVGPDGEGNIPGPFIDRSERIGRWLSLHREAIECTEPILPLGRTDVTEFITHGYQTVKGTSLYMIIRFWNPSGKLRIADLDNRVLSAEMLSTKSPIPFLQDDRSLVLDMPISKPCDLYPVIHLRLDGPPRAKPFMQDRLWTGDPQRFLKWARDGI